MVRRKHLLLVGLLILGAVMFLYFGIMQVAKVERLQKHNQQYQERIQNTETGIGERGK